MSDGELEHLMSQLGGQIQTMDTPALLGFGEIPEANAPGIYVPQSQASQKQKEIDAYHAKTKTERDAFHANSFPSVFRSNDATESTHNGKHPANRFTHDNWENVNRDGTKRDVSLPTNWNPDTTTIRNTVRKNPFIFHTREPIPKPADWHELTHHADNTKRKHPIILKPGKKFDPNHVKPTRAYTGPSTHHVAHEAQKHGSGHNSAAQTQELNRLAKRVKHLELENSQLRAKIQKITLKSFNGKPKQIEKLLSGATTPRSRIKPQARPYGFDYDAQHRNKKTGQ